MAKRLRNPTRIPLAEPDEITEEQSTRAFAHRRTPAGRTRVNEDRTDSVTDSSRERRNRKRQRNSEMYSTGRNASSAGGSRNRADGSSNRNHENASLLNIASARGFTQSQSGLENGATDLVKRAFELFNQARTASQSMETLVSENENILQGFKMFLEDNLPQSNGAKNVKCRDCIKNKKDWAQSCQCHRNDTADVQVNRKRSQSSQTSAQQQSNSHTSITWPQEVMSSLKCTICQDFCHQCVTACPCGHLFCGGCLSTWFDRCEEFKTCPTCRERVQSVHKNVPADHLIRNYLSAHPEEKRTDEELSNIHMQDRLFVAGVSMFNSGATVSEQRSQRALDPRVMYVTDDDDDDDDDSDSSYGSVTLNTFGGMRNETTDSDGIPNDHTFTHSRGHNQRQSVEHQPVRATRTSARLQSRSERAGRSPALAYRTRRAVRNRQVASSRTADSPPRRGVSPEVASQSHSGIGYTLTTNQGPVRIRPGQWYHMPSNYGESRIDITVDATMDIDRLSEASQDIVTSVLQEDEESAVESVEELPLISRESLRDTAGQSLGDRLAGLQRVRRGQLESNSRGTQRRSRRNARPCTRGSRHIFPNFSSWNSPGLCGIETAPNLNRRLDNPSEGLQESSNVDETTSNGSEEMSSTPSRDSILRSHSENENEESASEEEDEPIDSDASNF